MPTETALERNDAAAKKLRLQRKFWHLKVAKAADAVLADVVANPENYAWAIQKHGLKKPAVLVEADGSPHTVGSDKEPAVAAKKTAKKPAKKSSKKAAKKATTPKKRASKKAATPKKRAAKKAATPKKTAKKRAAKKAAKKAATPKKRAAKKSAAKKRVAKKPVAKKAATPKKRAAKKVAKKVATPKKRVAKKPAAKKPAAKKAATPKKHVCEWCTAHGVKGSKNHPEATCPAKSIHEADVREKHAAVKKAEEHAAEKLKAAKKRARDKAKGETAGAPAKKAAKGGKKTGKKPAKKAAAEAPAKKVAKSGKKASKKAGKKGSTKKASSKKASVVVKVPRYRGSRSADVRNASEGMLRLGVASGPMRPGLSRAFDENGKMSDADREMARSGNLLLDVQQSEYLSQRAKIAADEAKKLASEARRAAAAVKAGRPIDRKATRWGGHKSPSKPRASKAAKQAEIAAVTQAAMTGEIPAREAEKLVQKLQQEIRLEESGYGAAPEKSYSREQYEEDFANAFTPQDLAEVGTKLSPSELKVAEEKLAAGQLQGTLIDGHYLAPDAKPRRKK